MSYLCIFENPFARQALAEVKLSNCISDNLAFSIRPYQDEAFKRYLYLEKAEFPEKPGKPYHLLFNMATGSGKTLVMAGLILHLIQKVIAISFSSSTPTTSFRKPVTIF